MNIIVPPAALSDNNIGTYFVMQFLVSEELPDFLYEDATEAFLNIHGIIPRGLSVSAVMRFVFALVDVPH